MRDAVVHLNNLQLTLNGLAEEALSREVNRLQQEHNKGKPFPLRAAAFRPERRVQEDS